MKRCENAECGKRFTSGRSYQRFCCENCRRRVQHLRHVAKYPEEKTQSLQKLLEWKKKHPFAKRVKRRFFPRVGMPTWLTGR